MSTRNAFTRISSGKVATTLQARPPGWVWPLITWLIAGVAIRYALIVSQPLIDALNYWRAWNGPLYGTGFVYPPAGALLFMPAAILPFDWFAAALLLASVAAGVWLLWPLSLPLRLPALVALLASLVAGNAAVLLAVPLALAPRWPLLWAFVAWSKVTPAVGMITLVHQRRWRELMVVLNVCALIGLATLVVVPGMFRAWLDVAGEPTTSWATTSWWLGDDVRLAPPIWLRLAIASAIAWFGASRPWTLAVAAIIATPDLNLATAALFAAAPRLQEGARLE